MHSSSSEKHTNFSPPQGKLARFYADPIGKADPLPLASDVPLPPINDVPSYMRPTASSSRRESERSNKGVPPARYGFGAAREVVNSPEWREAIEKEKSSMEKFNTWKLVPRPKDQPVLPAIWSLEVKRNGTRKARLCVGGHREPSIPDQERFAPTASMTSLRVICALKCDADIYQGDVPSAYLQTPLKTPRYMEIPDGIYQDEKNKDYVLLLLKAQYGLLESGNLWNLDNSSFLVSLGYKQAKADPCIFLKGESIIILYVDDLLLFNVTIDIRAKIAQKYSVDFESSNELDYIGVDTKQNRYGITMNSSSRYIGANIPKLNSVITPIGNGIPEAAQDSPDLKSIGQVVWVSQTTRPDVSYAVSRSHDPNSTGVKRIQRYLNGTSTYGLGY